jgi:hypothetical protein
LEGTLPNTILDTNPIMDSIQFFVKKNHMNVVFYCAPFCKNNQNQDYTLKLKARIAGFKDFARVITDDKMFLNCNHLNNKGAEWFTEIFAEEVLMNNTK